MPKRFAPARKFPGDYHIIDEVASSATSRIFLAETISSPQQLVAIKLLYTTHLDSQQEEAFRQEIHLFQQLHHPSILSFITAECDKGVPYIVMAYAPNSSLDKSMHHQAHLPWPQKRALTIISQVGQALYYAHRHNIVHCNLKPQNILLDAQEHALLADFHLLSLPELLHASASTTYMAPEELLGEKSKACDQYALGCIAYEMLTGHTPYHASSLYYPGSRHRLPTLVAPTLLNPLLTPRVEQAILKALAPEPVQRHRNIQAFLTALGTLEDEDEDNATGEESLDKSRIETQSRALSNPRSTLQPPARTAAFEEIAASASALQRERANYQRNSPSRPKTYFNTHKKLMLALSCILLGVCIIGGLYWLVSLQSQSRLQPTPTPIKTHQSIMTTTTIAAPSIATSPVSTVTNQSIIIQPLPTQPIIGQSSPTSITIPSAIITPTVDTVTPIARMGTLIIDPTHLEN